MLKKRDRSSPRNMLWRLIEAFRKANLGDINKKQAFIIQWPLGQVLAIIYKSLISVTVKKSDAKSQYI
jgi:hypothetical protein